MRAFALDEFGQPGSVHDLPDPRPTEGQVRVRVAAAALNPFDNFVVQGNMKDRMEHRFPLIPASGLAGTVDELGPDAKGFAVGDHVFELTGKMVLGERALAELTTATHRHTWHAAGGTQ
jgi:NADPH:quinone reductase-like Zn-dependent oxidoreductase